MTDIIGKIAELREKSRRNKTSDLIGSVPFERKPAENKTSPNKSAEKPPLSTSNQNANSVNTCVLACIVGGLHCPDHQLFQKESRKISKALYNEKDEINFEELSWYFASKYPKLCEAAEKILATNMNAETFHVKTSNIILSCGLPLNMELEQDLEFNQKKQKRHRLFVEFIKNKSPDKMSIEELAGITGSMDYVTFYMIDREKHSEFVNAGYDKLISFAAGENSVSKEKLGEAYILFNQVLKELHVGYERHDIMQKCVLPQLENIANDRPVEYQKALLDHMVEISSKRYDFNKKYIEDSRRREREYDALKDEMKRHTHYTKDKKCYKDSGYYDALWHRVFIKYRKEIEMYDFGIENNRGKKALQTIEHLQHRSCELEKNSHNSYHNTTIKRDSRGL